MRTNKTLPPTYLLIAIILEIILNFAFPILHLIPSPWTLVGIIPILAGVLINLSADRAFHQAETTVNPLEIPSTLVSSGPYRLTRNPMYLGFVLLLFGEAVLLGSLSPFLAAPALAVLLDRMFIRMEEQKLAQKFGSAWLEYKSHSRRWL